MLIINPGSRIAAQGEGWTSTLDQARKNAQDWFDTMKSNGFSCASSRLPARRRLMMRNA